MARINRLPKFKGCKHEWRLLKKFKGYFCFYCVKCLLFALKDPDRELKECIKQVK